MKKYILLFFAILFVFSPSMVFANLSDTEDLYFIGRSVESAEDTRLYGLVNTDNRDSVWTNKTPKSILEEPRFTDFKITPSITQTVGIGPSPKPDHYIRYAIFDKGSGVIDSFNDAGQNKSVRRKFTLSDNYFWLSWVNYTGSFVSNGGETSPILVKYDYTGDSIYKKVYKEKGANDPADIHVDKKGNIVMVQTNDDTDAKIRYIDGNDGSIIWEKFISNFNVNYSVESLSIDSNNNILIGGEFYGKSDAGIVKLNDNGDSLLSIRESNFNTFNSIDAYKNNNFMAYSADTVHNYSNNGNLINSTVIGDTADDFNTDYDGNLFVIANTNGDNASSLIKRDNNFSKLWEEDKFFDKSYSTFQLINESLVGYSTNYPNADFSFSPSNPNSGEIINFTDQSSDSSGTIESWEWDFGNGDTSSRQNPVYTYFSSDTYSVQLVVTDNDGSQDTITKKVFVDNPLHLNLSDTDLVLSEVDYSGVDTPAFFGINGHTGETLWVNTNIEYGTQLLDGIKFEFSQYWDNAFFYSKFYSCVFGNINPISGDIKYKKQISTCSNDDFIRIRDLSTSDTSIYIATTNKIMYKYDYNGNLIYKKDFSDSPSLRSIESTKDNDLYLVTLDTVAYIDGKDGEILWDTPLVKFDEGLFFQNARINSNDKLIVYSSNIDTGGHLVKYNKDGGTDFSYPIGFNISNISDQGEDHYFQNIDIKRNDRIAGKYNVPNGSGGSFGYNLVQYDKDANFIVEDASIVSSEEYEIAHAFTPSFVEPLGTNDYYGYYMSYVPKGNSLSNPKFSKVSYNRTYENIFRSPEIPFDHKFDDKFINLETMKYSVFAQASEPPTADFIVSDTNPDVNESVQFTDKSSDLNGSIESWYWDFGDGDTSTQQNPTHSYSDTGTYTIDLVVTDDQNLQDTVSKNITVSESLASSFNISVDTPITGETIQFTSTSFGNPDTYLWEFGNGDTSSLQDPIYTYDTPGVFDVKLTIQKDSNTDTFVKTIQVYSKPNAKFTFSPSDPITNETIQFTDQSTDTDGIISSWNWDFGDGSTSTQQNPTHSYSSSGSYNVQLVVTDDTGFQDTVTKTVSVSEELIADFTSSPDSPLVGESVQFTDQSSGSINNYLWEFGDGDTSNQQNPSHSYSSSGSYDITLTVSNNNQEDSITKTKIIYEKPNSNFNFSPSNPNTGEQVQFTDQSSDNDGSISSYNWGFGDGSTSTQQNPTHTYNDTGDYTVQLVVTDDDGFQDTSSQIITVTDQLVADFTSSPDSPLINESVQFIDQSSGSPDTYSWEFGDGGTSDLANPSHSYSYFGNYNVTLTVLTDIQEDSATKTKTIYTKPVAGFTFSPSKPITNETIQFTNNSTDSDGTSLNYDWDFGDGSISTQKDPTHSYTSSGTYTVQLVTTDTSGFQDTATKDIFVEEEIIVDFTSSTDSPILNESIQFTDQSSGPIDNYTWDFGDGNTSTQQNPTHSYNSYGSFDVKLTVSNQNQTDSIIKTKTIYTKPVAGFTFSPSKPITNETIQFTNNSTDSDGTSLNYDWDFGDGGTSIQENPSYSYSSSGTYTVQLVVTDNDGFQDTTTKDVFIEEKLVASFTSSPDSPLIDETVNFSDNSSGNINSYNWDFGDGSSSSNQNPNHSYNTHGIFSVKLTISNQNQTDSTINNIHVLSEPTADFSYSPSKPDVNETIQFTDNSIDVDGSIQSWSWDFGDGSTSNQQNPTHSYNVTGTYNIQLVVTDDNGFQDTIVKSVTIQPTLVADFTFSPSDPEVNESIQFTNQSSGSPTSFKWEFGDNNVSVAQNPTHSYNFPTTYDVTLTVERDDDKDSKVKQVTIFQGPVADFDYNPSNPEVDQTVVFTDDSNDQDGSIVSYSWDFGNGETSTNENDGLSYRSKGTYNVSLTVTDDDGLTDSITKDVKVTNKSLVADFDVITGTPKVGEPVKFKDTSTDSNDTIQSWNWDFGNGDMSKLQNPENTYDTVKSFEVQLNVQSSSGQIDTVAKSVSLIRNVDFTWIPKTPRPTFKVTFDEKVQDNGQPTNIFEWDLQTGVTKQGERVTHRYSRKGNYPVTLTIDPSGQNPLSATKTIEVTARQRISRTGGSRDGSSTGRRSRSDRSSGSLRR